MCRALIYTGHPLLLDALLFASSSSLVRQTYDPRQLNMLNLGGFGLAAWDRGSHNPDVPFVYRSTTLPLFDRNLRVLAQKVRAECVLAHVRGIPYTSETGFGEQNLHPFQYPGFAWAMAHNGSLEGHLDLRGSLLPHVKPAIARCILGTTDSEGVYALVMSQLADPARDASPAALVDALLRSLRVIRQLRAAHGHGTASSLNLFFTNGRDAVAMRFAFNYGCYPTDSPAAMPAQDFRYLSLWYTVGERFGAERGDWRMLGDPAASESVLIASEPLTRDTTGWVEVPEYTILIAERTARGVRTETLPVDV